MPNRAKTDDVIAPDGSLERAEVSEAIVPEDLPNRADADEEIASADSSERTETAEEGLLEGSAEHVETDDDILLKEALGRARQYLSLCNVGDEGAEQLRGHFQGIVDRYCKKRDADVCTQAWIPVLSFFVSYLGLLTAVFDNDAEGQRIFLFVLPIILVLLIVLPVVSRRKKWETAFDEGGLHKLVNIISDLTVFLTIDEERLQPPASSDGRKDAMLGQN